MVSGDREMQGVSARKPFQSSPGIAWQGRNRRRRENQSNEPRPIVSNSASALLRLRIEVASAHFARDERGELDSSTRRPSARRLPPRMNAATLRCRFRREERREEARVEIQHPKLTSNVLVPHLAQDFGARTSLRGQRGAERGEFSSTSDIGRFGCETGCSRAVGRPWRVITTSSPASTLSRSSLRWAFAWARLTVSIAGLHDHKTGHALALGPAAASRSPSRGRCATGQLPFDAQSCHDRELLSGASDADRCVQRRRHDHRRGR